MYNLVSFDTPHHNKDNEYTHHPFKKKPAKPASC